MSSLNLCGGACAASGMLVLFIGEAAGAAGRLPIEGASTLVTVTVTGSALRRTDTETPSPLTVIDAAEIERSGLTTISDILRSISADNSGTIPTAITNGFARGSAGVATTDCRVSRSR